MLSNRLIFLPSLVLCFLTISHSSYAYDQNVTHPDLTEAAAQQSILNDASGHALTDLDLASNSVDEYLEGTQVFQLMRKGAIDEDGASLINQLLGSRFLNHFHNPLRPWPQAGLNDTIFGIHFTGESSLLWAQDPSANPDWSWQAVRNDYLTGITAESETDRQDALAKTFQGIGHLVHLVQDAAAPAHVRNHAHPLDGLGIVLGYETWAANNFTLIQSLSLTPLSPTVDLRTFISGNIPISAFWDTNSYDGSNPSASLSQGLAEYTNANFASDDTIFTENFPVTDAHYFPYPRQSSTQEYVEQIGTDTNGTPIYRTYFSKVRDGEAIILHFAVQGRVYKYLSAFPAAQRYFIGLDEECHLDYANRLIPRATGYSIGLINYFFRVKLDKQDATSVGSTQIPNGFRIVNNGPETLEGGEFHLYYDDTDGNRHEIVSLSFYDANGNPTSSPDFPINPGAVSTTIFSFRAPDSSMPTPNVQGQYVLLFKGLYGGEEESVGVRLLSFNQTPYVFIIEESVALMSTPRDENGSSGSEVFLQTFWDGCPQTVTGRFVIYGSVQRISLKVLYPLQLTDQLFIDGQPAVNNTWVFGSSATEPKTWRVERSCTNPSAPPWLEVQLTNGDVFTQPVIMYVDAGHSEVKQEYFDTSLFVYAAVRSQNAFLSIFDSSSCCLRHANIPGLGTLKSNEQFKFVQVNNHTPAESYEIFYQGNIFYKSLQVGFDLKYFGQINPSIPPGYFQFLREEPVACDATCFANLPLQDPFPLTITAQMDRIYSQKEMDFLRAKGIKPEYYSIIFK